MEQGFETLANSQRFFRGFDQIWTKPELIRAWRAFYHGSLRYMDDPGRDGIADPGKRDDPFVELDRHAE